MKYFFSIICASKNEQGDINSLLDSFLNLNYPNKELIIVDDSTDDTKKVIKSYIKKSNKIFLINGENNGCCNARNLGISKSRGDVIIFMTADSFFNDYDFLNKISKYYDSGYDAVMTGSQISNIDNIWSNYINSIYQNKIFTQNSFSPLTTQGYSVRKKAAIEVGLIDRLDSSFNICRDWTLIKKMDLAGYKKIFDKDIICHHKHPDNFIEFYLTHFTRGAISLGYNKFMRGKNGFFIFLFSILKFLRYLFSILIIYPFLKRIFSISRYSKYSLFSLIWVDLVKNISFTYGEIATNIKNFK